MFGRQSFAERLLAATAPGTGELTLEHGSRVAVVGGGPAGSLFAYFLLRMCDVLEIRPEVTIYEPRQFTCAGPAGCNHCGGIVSESLLQLLAAEGINLPASVVQRGIDSYMLHMDVGSVAIDTPSQQKRIAAVYRGNGPRCGGATDITGLDNHLQQMAIQAGAKVEPRLIDDLEPGPDGVRLRSADGDEGIFDLVTLAAGINSHLVDRVAASTPTFERPDALKTFICEFELGRETIERSLGSSMHVFLLDIPRLEFAALVPKGDFVTACILGDDIDAELVQTFLDQPEVRGCFPDGELPANVCHCFPRINVKPRARPYGDRLVMIGDCGVTRLYKDGIGAAYRTAKAAASTAALCGIAGDDFARHYWPVCCSLERDNLIGRFMFAASHQVQRLRFARRAMHRMTAAEQCGEGRQPLSNILWDIFTGSAPYSSVLMRSFDPRFLAGMLWHTVAGNILRRPVAADDGGAA
jgi:flavin-dependent dehydrogenase